jgi:hypothetical protein
VAFCEIEKGPPVRRCPRVLRGTVVDLNVDLNVDGDGGGDGGTTTGFVLDLGESRGTIEVVLSDDTAIFDETAARVGPEAIELGDDVSLRGRLDRTGRILALVVIVGDPLLVHGTIVDLVSGGFILDPADGEEVAESTRVEVTDGTLIYTGCDTPVGPEALRERAEVWVAGGLLGDPTRLRAAVIQVRHLELSGELTAIRASDGGYILSFDPEGDAEPLDVFLPPDGTLRLQADGPIPPTVLGSLLGCRRLAATVRLDPTVSDDRALEVIVKAEEVSGKVVSVAASSRLVDVGGTMVQLREGARILDVSTHVPLLVSLSSVRPGDEVRAFGLATCAGGAVEFLGFAMLIEERG